MAIKAQMVALETDHIKRWTRSEQRRLAKVPSRINTDVHVMIEI